MLVGESVCPRGRDQDNPLLVRDNDPERQDLSPESRSTPWCSPPAAGWELVTTSQIAAPDRHYEANPHSVRHSTAASRRDRAAVRFELRSSTRLALVVATQSTESRRRDPLRGRPSAPGVAEGEAVLLAPWSIRSIAASASGLDAASSAGSIQGISRRRCSRSRSSWTLLSHARGTWSAVLQRRGATRRWSRSLLHQPWRPTCRGRRADSFRQARSSCLSTRRRHVGTPSHNAWAWTTSW